MIQVWGVELVPTGELIARFRAEAAAEKKLKTSPESEVLSSPRRRRRRRTETSVTARTAAGPSFWLLAPLS